MALLSDLDIYNLEYAVVRSRNRLKFFWEPKGDRQARKVFCLGTAKSGTSSLHGLFEENGLRSLHSAGNWPVAQFDAFSDRGDYRPFQAYEKHFPNAIFILNCRPLGNYLRSLAIHRTRKRAALPKGLLNHAMLKGQAIRRETFHIEVLRYFVGKKNLIVVDIEKPGAISFVAQRLGLDAPRNPHRHQTKIQPSDDLEMMIESALSDLGFRGSRLILSDRPEIDALAALLPETGNLWL
ncbi:MAG: hypothetical protein K9G43_01410 [Rhodobacteraceae bacterium]|nr:hypothetical protein [Paracoccaceae bacterium]